MAWGGMKLTETAWQLSSSSYWSEIPCSLGDPSRLHEMIFLPSKPYAIMWRQDPNKHRHCLLWRQAFLSTRIQESLNVDYFLKAAKLLITVDSRNIIWKTCWQNWLVYFRHDRLAVCLPFPNTGTRSTKLISAVTS